MPLRKIYLHNKIVWASGALAVILTCCIYFGLFTSDDHTMKVNIGTYGGQMYVYSFDTKNLEFNRLESAEARNASYVIEAEEHVYAVSETGDGSGVYSFDSFDGLVMTAEKRQTGADPCFIMAYDDKVLTADYTGGSVSVFPLNDGVIGDCVQHLQFEGSGPVECRQESSHIHQLKVLPGTDWILASNLGADVIHVLRFDVGSLVHVSDVECPAGSGPRHMEFNATGDRLYCICELSGEVLVYEVTSVEEAVPSFSLLQRIKADEVNAGGSADIHMHPSGKYLYTSHRLDNDGIAVFSVGENGLLEKIGYSRTARHPRNFMITPDGSLLLVTAMHDNLIQVFRIAEDGTLTLTGSVLRFASDQPSCITLATL